MQAPTRTQILNSLLALEHPTEVLARELATLSWDPPDGEPAALLTPEHIVSVLRRYLAGSIAPVEVESWANLIEGREDLDFAAPARDTIKDCLFELANPEITEPLTPDMARAWVSALSPA